jgi:hypothetical protein
MAAVIVVASVVLSVAFTIAWAVRPGLRAWIERPKHVLDRNLRAYDEALAYRDGRHE